MVWFSWSLLKCFLKGIQVLGAVVMTQRLRTHTPLPEFISQLSTHVGWFTAASSNSSSRASDTSFGFCRHPYTHGIHSYRHMDIFFLKVYRSDITCIFWPIACDCNGRSQECYFDPELYRSTGHGGHCTNCRDNTDGAKCERCRENFFRLGNTEACSPCHCSPVGK